MAPLHEKRLILFYISVSWFVGQSVEQVLSNQYPNGPFSRLDRLQIYYTGLREKMFRSQDQTILKFDKMTVSEEPSV